MLEIFNRFYKLISVLLVLLLAWLTSFLPDDDNALVDYIDSYLANVVGWLGVLVLFWLWKFEKDWKQDLKSSLTRKVKQNEQLISQLWNVFSEQNAEAELEKGIRSVLERYPSIVLHKKDVKIGEKVRNTIASAEYILQQREYREPYEATNVYPGPFYEMANKSILATNVGSPASFWNDRVTLVDLNRTAVERIRPLLKNGEDPIRRVFIISDVDEVHELTELMLQLLQAGVMVRYLAKHKAQELAVANVDGSPSPIMGLEDFTVFDTGQEGLKYSGRFEDLSANQKRIIISSNPQTIEDLTNQFNALWNASFAFEGQIDESRIRGT